MNYDEKLNDFINHVMNEASQKKSAIEAEMEAEKKKALDEKEIQLLDAAYRKIQQAKNRAGKEGSDLISKVTIENKRMLFQKREAIIAAVFSEVHTRLKEFLKTPDYETFLMTCIEGAVGRLGAGKKTVYIDRDDMRFEGAIKARFPQEQLTIVVSETGLIGGCIVKNEDSNLIVDDSLLVRIEESKDRFIMESGLIVE